MTVRGIGRSSDTTCDHPDELRRKEVIYMKYERQQCVMT